MNFQVPQFIEVEDKIFGPLTFKQFVYLAGGAALCFIEWVYIPWHILAVLFILPTAGFALALAFYKVNDRSFILVLEAALRYTLGNKLYVWKQGPNNAARGQQPAMPELGKPEGLALPKLSGSQLKDLAWSLDVKENIR
jgi:hypothetical protein